MPSQPKHTTDGHREDQWTTAELSVFTICWINGVAWTRGGGLAGEGEGWHQARMDCCMDGTVMTDRPAPARTHRLQKGTGHAHAGVW